MIQFNDIKTHGSEKENMNILDKTHQDWPRGQIDDHMAWVRKQLES